MTTERPIQPQEQPRTLVEGDKIEEGQAKSIDHDDASQTQHEEGSVKDEPSTAESVEEEKQHFTDDEPVDVQVGDEAKDSTLKDQEKEAGSAETQGEVTPCTPEYTENKEEEPVTQRTEVTVESKVSL